MFNINSKHRILLSKGDSAEFSLFLNQGTSMQPVPYSFCTNKIISIKCTNLSKECVLQVSIDTDVWFAMIKDSGIYQFKFNVDHWEHNSAEVKLADYGIICTGEPSTNDIISITSMSAKAEYIEFYLKYINSDDFILYKKIAADGTVLTKFNNRGIISESTVSETAVDNEGNMMILLNPEDTSFISAGEYCYYIKACLIDDTGKAVINTVTPKYSFILEEA